MKQTLRFLFLFSIVTIFILGSSLWGQEKKNANASKDSKTDNGSGQLIVVEKVKPVPSDVKTGFDSIDGEDGLAYVKFLSSDALEGRDTATTGHQAAAEFAAALFESWGLKPAGYTPKPSTSPRKMFFSSGKVEQPKRSYFQNVVMKEYFDGCGSAEVMWHRAGQSKTIRFTREVDYKYDSIETIKLSAPVVFVGFGISENSLKFDEYKNVDVKGKIVMALTETPRKGDKDSPFQSGEMKEKYYPTQRFGRSVSPKPEIAMKKGAVAILLVENSVCDNGDVADKVLEEKIINDEEPIISGKRRMLSLVHAPNKNPWETIPTIRISRDIANQILQLNGQDLDTLKTKIEKTMKPVSMPLTGVTFTVNNSMKTKLVSSPNVLGYIEGSDPKLKDEVVVIGAHMDHLGKRGDYIYNGADDNASGSAAVMEVAQAFALNPKKPKRTVVFALWTGEEKGLLGSRHYVANPAFPLKKTIAYLNLDMVSRPPHKKTLGFMLKIMKINISKEELAKVDNNNLMSLSYPLTSPDVLETFKTSNEYVGLSLITRGTDGIQKGRGGSDHMSFAYKHVPFGSFFGGMTPDFHQPTDTYEKMTVDLMKKTTQLTYLTAMALADR